MQWLKLASFKNRILNVENSNLFNNFNFREYKTLSCFILKGKCFFLFLHWPFSEACDTGDVIVYETYEKMPDPFQESNPSALFVYKEDIFMRDNRRAV